MNAKIEERPLSPQNLVARLQDSKNSSLNGFANTLQLPVDLSENDAENIIEEGIKALSEDKQSYLTSIIDNDEHGFYNINQGLRNAIRRGLPRPKEDRSIDFINQY